MIEREQLKKLALIVLRKCVGKHNAIGMPRLFYHITGQRIIPAKMHNQTRILRSVITQLRQEKHPIVSGASGYWMAEDDDELEQFVIMKLKSACRQFGLARQLSMVPVSTMIQQYNFNFTDEENKND